MVTKFFDYLQILVTVAVVGVWVWLQVGGHTVSPEVYGFMGAILGYFFRGASTQAVKLLRRLKHD